MRLSADEVSAIGGEIRQLDVDAEVYLYGSRADDGARGGDRPPKNRRDLLVDRRLPLWRNPGQDEWD